MLRFSSIAVVCTLLIAMQPGRAAEESLKVLTVLGVVEKVEKDVLTIKHRSPETRTDKSLALKLTGTSRFSTLSTQKRGDKIVLVQKDVEAKGLVEKQSIAVIYANSGSDHVLLTAVVHGE